MPGDIPPGSYSSISIATGTVPLWLEKDGAFAKHRLEGLTPVCSLMFGQMHEDASLRNRTPSLSLSRMGSRGRPIRLSAKSLRFGDLSLCHLSHYPPFQFVLRRYRVWRRWNHELSPHCRSEWSEGLIEGLYRDRIDSGPMLVGQVDLIYRELYCWDLQHCQTAPLLRFDL